MRLPPENGTVPPVEYRIQVSVVEPASNGPRIVNECLHHPLVFGRNTNVKGETGFRTNTQEKNHEKTLTISAFPKREARGKTTRAYGTDVPILSQVAQQDEGNGREMQALARFVTHELRAFRFLDPSPAQMRIPSQPGLTMLGDRGENLSSVLAAVCDDSTRKEVILEWVRKLTPMDVNDLLFDTDAAGRISLRLVEKDGRSVSAMSASDGTLRFLAILAALFGPEPSSFYFIEELENGIHPTRLSLLVDLVEHQSKRRGIQIVATSHSPQLLQFLSEESLTNTSLVYRLPNHPDARIKPILEIRNALRVIKEQPVWVLHASSWFEDVLNLTEGAAAEAIVVNQSAS
jgi:hypothetical protein